MAPGCQII